jgi:poly(ADP-ribose) glycohydrolase ARH3
MKQQLEAKFRGTLLGVAVGDAIGAPFEGGATTVQSSLPRLDDVVSPLRYTDDTHMTLGVAESLMAQGDFDGAHMAAILAQNYAAEPWRGYGAGPPQVFRLLAQGVAWDQASRTLFGGTGSYGNGAAMRVAPIALFAFRDLERVARLARQCAVITHTHELGLEGAVLQATAIALLLQHPSDIPLDPVRFLQQIRHYVQHAVYLEKLNRLQTLLPGSSADQVIAQLGTGIAAPESVPTALYAFLRSPQSFVTAVTYAVSLGGDTDTIAAMTGALVGAYLGEEAIPEVAREQVEGAARLREVADALLALSMGVVPDQWRNAQRAPKRLA